MQNWKLDQILNVSSTEHSNKASTPGFNLTWHRVLTRIMLSRPSRRQRVRFMVSWDTLAADTLEELCDSITLSGLFSHQITWKGALNKLVRYFCAFKTSFTDTPDSLPHHQLNTPRIIPDYACTKSMLSLRAVFLFLTGNVMGIWRNPDKGKQIQKVILLSLISHYMVHSRFH